jgi:hypothetical protein
MTPDARIPVVCDDLIRVEAVDDCAFYVRDVFEQHFGGDPPDFPWHFVALYKASRNCFVAVGYLHCSQVGDLCLCGGLVHDERAMRRMPAPHQAALRGPGGVDARLLDKASRHFAHMPALWATVGDDAMRETFRRARFEDAPAPHLMVRWHADVGQARRDDLLARVIDIGPF